MKRLVCFASIAAFASVAVSQDSRPTSQPKESPKQALRARADEYARLRLADDWSTLYGMTEPEHRAKVSRERFMQFHGRGYLLTREIELLDVGFDDALNNGATRFRVTVELQPDKLPIKPKVEMKPEDLRKATDYDLMWRRIDGTWYFAMEPEIVSGMSDGSPIQPVAELDPRLRGTPVLRSRVLDAGFYNSGQWRGAPAVADLDGDGNQDLVCSLRRWDRQTHGDGLFVYLGRGDGTFVERIEGLDRMLGYGGSDTADFDGDGRLDIAFSGHDRTPSVFLNRLDTDEGWVAATPDGLPTGVICADVAAGDFDRDGHADVISIGQFPGKGGLQLFRGDGKGGFDGGTEILGQDHYGSRVVCDDLDRDGHVELIAAIDEGLRVYRWDDEHGCAVNTCTGHAPNQILGSDLALLIGDFDGRGSRDILVGGYKFAGHPSLRVFTSDEEGGWQVSDLEFGFEESAFDARLGRLRVNGPPALFVAGQFGIAVFERHEFGFELIGRVPGTTQMFNLAVLDANGDGKDEAVWIGEGGVRVYELLP